MKKQIIISAVTSALIGMSAFAYADNCAMTYQQFSAAIAQEQAQNQPGQLAQQMKYCPSFVLAFKSGDRVPVSIMGNFLVSDPNNISYVTVQQDFWVRIPNGANGTVMLSQDGKTYVPWQDAFHGGSSIALSPGITLNLNMKNQ